jgi:hypothetical protein
VTVAIKIWVLRSIDVGTTFETVDTSIHSPNIELLFDERTGMLRDTLYRPGFVVVPPGKFRVLTEVGEPWQDELGKHMQEKWEEVADYLSRAEADAALLQVLAAAVLEMIKATDGWLMERMEPHRVKLEAALAKSHE